MRDLCGVGVGEVSIAAGSYCEEIDSDPTFLKLTIEGKHWTAVRRRLGPHVMPKGAKQA